MIVEILVDIWIGRCIWGEVKTGMLVARMRLMIYGMIYTETVLRQCWYWLSICFVFFFLISVYWNLMNSIEEKTEKKEEVKGDQLIRNQLVQTHWGTMFALCERWWCWWWGFFNLKLKQKLEHKVEIEYLSTIWFCQLIDLSALIDWCPLIQWRCSSNVCVCLCHWSSHITLQNDIVSVMTCVSA